VPALRGIVGTAVTLHGGSAVVRTAALYMSAQTVVLAAGLRLTATGHLTSPRGDAPPPPMPLSWSPVARRWLVSVLAPRMGPSDSDPPALPGRLISQG